MKPSADTNAVARRDAEKTKARILEAARALFCAHGVDGVTMEAIARGAKVNKRMVYYYFGSKNDLYLTVLEDTYAARRRHDSELKLSDADPEQGMRRLVRTSFQYCRENPDYIKLLLAENLNGARYLKQSTTIRDLHGPLMGDLEKLLDRGRELGLFRAFADPLHLYLTIASLCFFFHSNNATLSVAFGRDFRTEAMALEREAHVEEVVMSYLAPRNPTERQAAEATNR